MININNKIRVGDILFCIRRGNVEVTKVENQIFYVKYKNVEYQQRYDEIGKLLFFPNTIRISNGVIKQKIIPMNYKECVSNKELLEKDIIYKEEARYLANTRDVIKLRIGELTDITSSPNYNIRGWTYSPSAEELAGGNAPIRKVDYTLYNELNEIKQENYNPYFARMDFEVSNEKNIKVYIGNRKLIKDGVRLVYDWREDLGQRYYRKNELKFSINSRSYKTTLIRNFEYDKIKLKKYIDIYMLTDENNDNNIETGSNIIADDFLSKVLKEKRNVSNIGNIISSIQENQNKIITEKINKNLIVQGCAGSGKTMILLHRLSYLIFNNENLDLRFIKIITPNNLFNLSINNLAKELDIDSIERMGVADYLIDKAIAYGIKILDIDINKEIPDEVYSFVYSEDYLNILGQQYLNYLNTIWIRLNDMGIKDIVKEFNISTEFLLYDIPKFSQIEDLVLNIEDEFKVRKEYLKKKIEKLKAIESDIKEFNSSIKSKNIFSRFNKLSSLEEKIYNDKLKYKKELEDEIEKYKFKSFLSMGEKKLKDTIQKMKNLIDNKGYFIQEEIYNRALKNKFKELGYEEYLNAKEIKVFTIVYLLYIHKGSLKVNDKFIYIDEGQDLNYFQYYLINAINNNSVVFNIFGDTNQVIRKTKGINNWECLGRIFSYDKYILNENYRNSKPISDYCISETGYYMNSLGVLHGKIRKTRFYKEDYNNIIYEFKCDTSKRKVIILKEFTNKIFNYITNSFIKRDLNIISSSKSNINVNKINVITVELAKGMEFDTTLVVTAGMNNNEKYIALTRALINNYIIDGDLEDNITSNKFINNEYKISNNLIVDNKKECEKKISSLEDKEIECIIKQAKELRRNGEAQKALDAICGINPENKRQLEDIILIRGAALKDLKRFSEAKECVKKVINLRNNSSNAYNLAGIIELMNGNIKEAEICFNRAFILKATKIGMTNKEVVKLLKSYENKNDISKIIKLLKDISPGQFEWL